MATTMIPETLTRDNVRAAIDAALAKTRNEPRWHAAISKVAKRLDKGGWAWNGSTLVMLSSDGTGQYTVTAHGCECVAFGRGLPCVHRASRKIIINATAPGFTSKLEAALPRISPAERAVDALNERAADADYAAIQEAADELFA